MSRQPTQNKCTHALPRRYPDIVTHSPRANPFSQDKTLTHVSRLSWVRFRLWTFRRAMTLLTAFVARAFEWLLTVWTTADVKSKALRTHVFLRSWTCSFLPLEAPALFLLSSMQRFLLHKIQALELCSRLGPSADVGRVPCRIGTPSCHMRNLDVP